MPPPPDLTASTCDSAPKNAGRSCSCIAASACCAGLRTSTSAEMLSSSVASIRPRVDDSTSNLVEAGGPLRSHYAAVTQPLRSLYAAVTQGMVGPRVGSSPKALTSSAIVVAIAVHSPPNECIITIPYYLPKGGSIFVYRNAVVNTNVTLFTGASRSEPSVRSPNVWRFNLQ
eukprot:COSAG02_NODE_97_length_37159_cov_37.660335_19_plen_172_part_00